MALLNKDIHLHQVFGDSISSDNPFIDDLFQKKTINNSNVRNSPVLSDMVPYPSASNLRISTMTAICHINVPINLDQLRNLIQSQGDGTIPSFHMTISIKKKKKKKVQTTRKNSFQNQCTFLVELPNGKVVNQKVFKNGNIQMTGLKSEVDGLAAIQILIDNITKNNEAFETPIVSDISMLKKNECNIVLINSDYSCGFKIKRDKLYEILGTYGLYVSYEPDIYPGVNAKFYWNDIYNNTVKPGICNCTISCDGKGTGFGNGQCKKVTISTFQSGNVIITGARNQQQTNDAYSFINKIFKKYYANIYRNSKDLKETGSIINGTYAFYINLSNIQNIDKYEEVLAKIKNKKISTKSRYSDVFKPIDTHKSVGLLKPNAAIKMDKLW